ncbi:MAG: SRPBCC domain-containing protein [Bacteroidota bacterium]
MQTESSNIEANREIHITRIIDTPCHLVFEAWSNPEHLKKWYAPQGCTIDIPTLDFKEGGVMHTCVRTLMGECWCKGVYKEIVPNEKIVFSIAFSDEAGNLVDNPPIGKDPEWPLETIVTVTFKEENGKTKFTLHQTALESVAKRTGAYSSWLQMFERLEELVTIQK